jgi:hypothetical protein
MANERTVGSRNTLGARSNGPPSPIRQITSSADASAIQWIAGIPLLTCVRPTATDQAIGRLTGMEFAAGGSDGCVISIVLARPRLRIESPVPRTDQHGIA